MNFSHVLFTGWMRMVKRRDEHIIEAIGRSRIVIRDGRVVEVGEPLISDCPLAKRFALPIPAITKDAIKANIEHRIEAFGMCTPDREVCDTREFVGFGASELLSFGLFSGLFDAAVLVCDGAGTVIATKPEMAQGIGGRMSGLVRTSPHKTVIDRIEQGGGLVLDREHARIDQLAGVALAVSEGYRTIAVTVADSDIAEIIRRIHPDTFIFAVHVTGLSHDQAGSLVSVSDLVTSCASGTIRETAGTRALLQAGITIPIFAMTQKGKLLILEKIRQSDEQVLIKSTRLPALGDDQPCPLV
jgi:putative methanogenesis marker protein 8